MKLLTKETISICVIINFMRFRELDFFRGVAILMMIAFHVVFDLNYFSVYEMNIHSIMWFAYITAAIFITLVGICLAISFSRGRKFSHFLFRGLKIFFFGMLITAATWFFAEEGTVWFGILHFIGISVIIAYPFLKYEKLNLVIAAVVFLSGLVLSGMTFSSSWMLWLGFMPFRFYTFDYFPLLPWFSLVLAGIFIGNRFYVRRRFKLPEVNNKIARLISFIGRHSLLIYLVHQPLLIIMLYLLH